MTVSNADAKLLEMSNEIVANGGLNYATITTADGLKLDNVPVIVSAWSQGTILGRVFFGGEGFLEDACLQN
jgi:molybdopterin-containing oxidoreductase family iron-sulfur binding subunit